MGEQDDVSLIHILPGCLGNERAVSGYEFGPRSMLPAEDMYMVHLTTPAGADDPRDDLEVLVDQIASGVGVLYKLFFTTQMTAEGSSVDPSLDRNIIRTSFPSYNVGYSESIEEAKKSFHLLYPEEEFLPAAPNPEDIKWPDEEETETVEKESGVEQQEVSEKMIDELDRNEENTVGEDTNDILADPSTINSRAN